VRPDASIVELFGEWGFARLCTIQDVRVLADFTKLSRYRLAQWAGPIAVIRYIEAVLAMAGLALAALDATIALASIPPRAAFTHVFAEQAQREFHDRVQRVKDFVLDGLPSPEAFAHAREAAYPAVQRELAALPVAPPVARSAGPSRPFLAIEYLAHRNQWGTPHLVHVPRHNRWLSYFESPDGTPWVFVYYFDTEAGEVWQDHPETAPFPVVVEITDAPTSPPSVRVRAFAPPHFGDMEWAWLRQCAAATQVHRPMRDAARRGAVGAATPYRHLSTPESIDPLPAASDEAEADDSRPILSKVAERIAAIMPRIRPGHGFKR